MTDEEKEYLQKIWGNLSDKENYDYIAAAYSLHYLRNEQEPAAIKKDEGIL